MMPRGFQRNIESGRFLTASGIGMAWLPHTGLKIGNQSKINYFYNAGVGAGLTLYREVI
jgi:hypothetical protein